VCQNLSSKLVEIWESYGKTILHSFFETRCSTCNVLVFWVIHFSVLQSIWLEHFLPPGLIQSQPMSTHQPLPSVPLGYVFHTTICNTLTASSLISPSNEPTTGTFLSYISYTTICNMSVIPQLTALVSASVREYVFYVFSRFKKTWLFTSFWNDLSKKRKKSLAKI